MDSLPSLLVDIKEDVISPLSNHCLIFQVDMTEVSEMSGNCFRTLCMLVSSIKKIMANGNM